MSKEHPVITESVYAPVLKTGDRFIAKTTRFPGKVFEFVGFAPFEPCGCQYIILKDVDTGNHLGVERLWFNEEYCGRKIILLDKKEGDNVQIP